MPEKQLTIAGYAAGASLAAVAMVYVFAPTFFIDGDANGNVSGRKRGAIGLRNPLNDCFINSVLQALAGLGDLRLYLIRETHRRTLDGEEVFANLVPDPSRPNLPPWKIDGLQRGIVTQGLKDVLDALNERPLYKKSIDAGAFIACLEKAFRQRISRQQQDAQEFLQVVAERLCDEYHAAHRARRAARNRRGTDAGSDFKDLDDTVLTKTLSKEAEIQDDVVSSQKTQQVLSDSSDVLNVNNDTAGSEIKDDDSSPEEEDGFPLEGKSESQIECLTCHFMPKASSTTFCSLTLNVPQVTATSLNSCFDVMFKIEYIEDFKCEKCRLVHAVELFTTKHAQAAEGPVKDKLAQDIESLQQAIATDPEKPPIGVELPDSSLAPKRKIARHQKITAFPKIMAIHLSRSIFDVGRSSMKNSAKVTFPESLPLGSLTSRQKYKLLSVVSHKGSHHSGHYESFRRQNVYAPFSTPNAFEKTGVYNSSTPTQSTRSTPAISTMTTPEFDAMNHSTDLPPVPEIPDLLSPTESTSKASWSSRSSTTDNPNPSPTKPSRRDTDTTSVRSVARSAISILSRSSTPRPDTSDSTDPSSDSQQGGTPTSPTNMARSPSKPRLSGTVSRVTRRKRVINDRWWRISDEKVKEAKTSEVLGMQKEVYLLFYEVERANESIAESP